MLRFKICAKVPEKGGRWFGSGLVEVDGRAVWGGERGVYRFDEANSAWNSVADYDLYGARLAVCGGRILRVGGWKDGVYSKKVMKLSRWRWSHMSDMLIGCRRSCVLSVSGDGIVVMGGRGSEDRLLNDVQVFDGTTQTWHQGPSLPQLCGAVSAVIHGNRVLAMGGFGMAKAVWCADIHDLVSHWVLCSTHSHMPHTYESTLNVNLRRCTHLHPHHTDMDLCASLSMERHAHVKCLHHSHTTNVVNL